jgi:GcrA cell cycle regulator
MIWNDAAVAKLKEMDAEGCSGAQIAQELGTTRNAVIGKINRMGLRLKRGKRQTRKHKAEDGWPTEKPRARKRRPMVKTEGGLDRMAAWLPPEPDQPADMKRCTLLQLTDKTCRWPIGDPREPGFCFCGNRIADETIYCNHHNRIAYTSAAQRARESAPKMGFAYYGPKT